MVVQMPVRDQIPPGAQIARSVGRVVAVFAGMTLVYAFMPFRDGQWWLDALIGVASIVAIVPLTVRRVREIKTTERPTMCAIEALVLMFTLLIFGFSALYITIDRSGTQFVGMHTRIDAVYFTVTTLSTVGFGDIHAEGQAAKLAVIAQICVDFTLLAVSVRVLLGATRQRLRPEPRAPRP